MKLMKNTLVNERFQVHSKSFILILEFINFLNEHITKGQAARALEDL